MSQTDNPTTRQQAKINPAEVFEGDQVALGINLHGTSEGQPGVGYFASIHQACAVGTVIDAPAEYWREELRNGEAVMVDFAVETPDGTVYRWQVDNGYVTGPHQGLGRRSDVGHFGGFYDPDAL